jgi:hypothetical protein
MWDQQTSSFANFRISSSLLDNASLVFSGGIFHSMPEKQARGYSVSQASNLNLRVF